MLKASFRSYVLHFHTPSGTSRGVLTDKETFFIKIWDDDEPNTWGIGECALFRGLSAEDKPGYEDKLREVCRNIEKITPLDLEDWSSIRFGMEMALADLQQGGRGIYYPSLFTEGMQALEINGLVWMGDRETMRQHIYKKLETGFHCIKLKIGAIDFESELSLLKMIRQEFGPKDVEIRVDANGAFSAAEAVARLDALAPYGLHSIEQPIRAGQWEEMAGLCASTPIPIALDEELIGVVGKDRKLEMLRQIRPQYVVLKPALHGGFAGAEEWIRLASQNNAGWWVTSALESNIGLSALAQWVATLDVRIPQGLGTGQLYTNNIPSPLVLHGEKLKYNHAGKWDFSMLPGFDL